MAETSYMRTSGDRLLIDIKVVPGASKNEIMGVTQDRIRIRIAAAPENGKANGELKAFLSKKLHCPKSEIILVSGEHSRIKTLSLSMEVAEKIKKLVG